MNWQQPGSVEIIKNLLIANVNVKYTKYFYISIFIVYVSHLIKILHKIWTNKIKKSIIDYSPLKCIFTKGINLNISHHF